MTRTERLGAAVFLAIAALGMIFDSVDLWRMTLCASALHEVGHILCYFLCTGRRPAVRLRAGGVCLRGAECLPRTAETLVLCAGPAVNLAAAGVCLAAARARASYAVYFFGAVNLCVGTYNLLPLGTLDGGRLLRLLVPVRYESAAAWAQRAFAAAAAVLLLFAAYRGTLPVPARASAAAAALYLMWQGAVACPSA